MDSFQQAAFGFTIPTSDFNPNCSPTDGEQYLQSVFYERTKCPAVVVKPLKANVQKTLHSTSSPASVWDQYAMEDLGDKAPSTLLPTNEWLRIQTHSFQALHDKVTAIRSTYANDCTRLDLPGDNEAALWLDYCQRNLPLLSNILEIQQRTLEKLIEHQATWLVDDVAWYIDNKHWYPQWVYGCLACLRLPLEPNLVSALREIVKTCIRLRNRLKADSIDDVLPLNLIICIVSNNFKQSDLGGRSQ